MVTINALKVETFISSVDQNVDGILVYGANEGLCSEIKNVLIEKLLGKDNDRSFSLAIIGDDLLKNDPSIISSELQAVSFLGGRRVVVINNGSDSLHKHLQTAWKRKDDKSVAIVQAGILTPRSKIRNMFEKDKRLIAVPCYEDDQKTLNNILSETLRKEKIVIDGATNQAIISMLSKDRRQTRAQIEKLVLLAGKEKKLSEEQVFQALENPDAITAEFIIDNTFEGKNRELARLYNANSIYNNNLDIGFIRIMNAHVNRLKTLRQIIDEGKKPIEALKLISPKFFFKREPSIIRQCELWSSQGKLNQALSLLLKQEVDIKNNIAIPNHVQVQRMTLNLSSLALKKNNK